MPDAASLERLRTERVVAVIRAPGPKGALAAAEALIEGGLRVMEVTYSTPGAGSVIAEVTRGQAPGVLVGAGTVRRAPEVADAVASGARFIVSPGIEPAVIEAAKEAGVMAIPGALTATEILGARALGADAVKLFPASIGGPGLLRALREPFPEVAFVPSGGVRLDNLEEWFAAGALAVAAGSSLCSREDIEAGRFDAIRERAARYAAAREGLPRPPSP